MIDCDRDELKDSVKATLLQHQGSENCITMTELYRATTGGTVIPYRRYDQTRVIRSIVKTLREEGSPIANSGNGYFWALSDDELQPTIDWFHSRAMSSLQQEAALKGIDPSMLVKQYEIELTQPEECNNGQA